MCSTVETHLDHGALKAKLQSLRRGFVEPSRLVCEGAPPHEMLEKNKIVKRKAEESKD